MSLFRVLSKGRMTSTREVPPLGAGTLRGRAVVPVEGGGMS